MLHHLQLNYDYVSAPEVKAKVSNEATLSSPSSGADERKDLVMSNGDSVHLMAPAPLASSEPLSIRPGMDEFTTNDFTTVHYDELPPSK